jgi:hypothetical protein
MGILFFVVYAPETLRSIVQMRYANNPAHVQVVDVMGLDTALVQKRTYRS